MKKNRKNRFFVVTGLFILCVAIFFGLHHLKSEDIRVVKSKHDNGMDKEVWVYKKNIFGNEKKVKELVYFDNGNKSSEIDYKKGKVNGWARMWFKNGTIHVEATYRNSKTHGIRRAYHKKNGRLFCRAEYKNGRLIRKRNWDKEGNEIYLPIDRE